MNGESRQRGSSLAWQMLGMLLAAAALGMVFNTLSPLGARLGKGSETPQQHSSSEVPKEGYYNETISISLEEASGADVAPQNSSDVNTMPAAQVPTITWNEVKALQVATKVLIIDTRAPAGYQAGHIPGAISIPAQKTDAELAAAMAGYAIDMPVVVYCGTERCNLSRVFAMRLNKLGFVNVKDMHGGMVEYLQAEGGDTAAPTE